MTELTQTAFPYLPISFLQKYEFTTADYLEKMDDQLLFFFDDSDQ